MKYGSTVLKTYEGMFLIDSKEAKKGSEVVEGVINGLIEKCKGQVVRFEKWDERRLAYEVDGVINGTYYLYYFTGEADTISTLNREIQLSSNVLRALFLRIKEVPEVVVRKPEDESEEKEGEGSGEKTEGEASSTADAADAGDTPVGDTPAGDAPAATEEPAAEAAAAPVEETAAAEAPAEAPPTEENVDSDKPEV